MDVSGSYICFPVAYRVTDWAGYRKQRQVPDKSLALLGSARRGGQAMEPLAWFHPTFADGEKPRRTSSSRIRSSNVSWIVVTVTSFCDLHRLKDP